MSGVEMVEIPLHLMENTVDVMQEAADDISCNVKDEYPKDSRDKYPTYQRRYERDMDIVHRIKALIAALNVKGNF